MVLTLDEYLRAHPGQLAEEAGSSELLAARTALALVAAHLCWSATLQRKVAYVPDNLLDRAPGASIHAIRSYYGNDVLVVPESVQFR